jgi:PD-(D/E)XK nuclease superfamily protein
MYGNDTGGVRVWSELGFKSVELNTHSKRYLGVFTLFRTLHLHYFEMNARRKIKIQKFDLKRYQICIRCPRNPWERIPRSNLPKGLVIEFRLMQIPFLPEYEMPIYYKGEIIGKLRVNFLVNQFISVELKALTNAFGSSNKLFGGL